MMALIFLLYFAVGVQILLGRTDYIKVQLVGCLFITLLWFNYHSNLYRQLINLWF